MAGIGIKLNKIFGKNTLATNLVGFGYSSVMTIAPMCVVIGAIMVMQHFLGFSRLGYAMRELFACTVLYVFIFALLSCSPFNAVLSRYLSDVIYNETYQDILPCFYTGMLMNIVFASLFGIPFCIHEYLTGQVWIFYVFAGYCGFVSLALVFYCMLYLSICKDYGKISLYFILGMLASILLSLLLVYFFHVEVSFAMLVSLDVGFWLIACMEMALVKSYFRENSRKYREVLRYFRRYWKLVGTNFFYTLGLYIHNFVYWTTDMRMVVVDSFVCAQPYDMATCLAMFTNLTASVIFISRVEMHFHERYKRYSEAVIGGRGNDIENAKRRMFYQLAEELLSLVRLQFIVSVSVFLLCVILLPQFGFGGLVMQLYPCLAGGYFILFVMYSVIIFLYYYNDLNGSLLTSLSFCLVTLLVSIYASRRLTTVWYGLGVVAGSLVGFTYGYYRIRKMERDLDIHIFCAGSIVDRGFGKKPSNKVYDKPLPVWKKRRRFRRKDRAAFWRR